MDILIKGENYGTAIGSVLKEIGIIISADRVFIGNIQNQSVSYPFSWCREGLASIKNLGFTGADFDEYVEMRKHLLEKNDSIAISDIHDIKETDRVTYQFLKAHDVHSIAEVPIFRDNHLYGFLGVINYDREKWSRCQVHAGKSGWLPGPQGKKPGTDGYTEIYVGQ